MSVDVSAAKKGKIWHAKDASIGMYKIIMKSSMLFILQEELNCNCLSFLMVVTLMNGMFLLFPILELIKGHLEQLLLLNMKLFYH